MVYLESSVVFWSLGAAQFIGLASTWLARLSEGSRSQAPCQWLFFACLGLIGLLTLLAIALGPGYGLACGTTLAVMVLGAIWDFRAHAHAQHS
jgi:hypothetical protein